MTLRVNTIQDDVDALERAKREHIAASARLYDAHKALRDRLVAIGPVVAVHDGSPWLYQPASDSPVLVDRVRCTFAYSATKPDADTLDDAHAEMRASHGVNPDVRPVWPSAEEMHDDDADPTIRALAAHAALDELAELEGEVA